jgi:hypothetical protein
MYNTQTATSFEWAKLLQPKKAAAELTGGNQAADAQYTSMMKWLHWTMAGGVLACVGLVKVRVRLECLVAFIHLAFSPNRMT